MDTKLAAKIAVKSVIALLLIGSAVGDFLSTRLELEDVVGPILEDDARNRGSLSSSSE